MAPTLAVAGWVAAFAAAVCVLVAWRVLACRMQAVARACHELRGPLTAARLGLELGVRRGPLSPDRLRALDLELGRAALAIDDLAVVGGGGTDPRGRWEEVEVRGLIADSVEAWRSFAEARGVEVTLHGSTDAAFVCGDRLRLAQATGNLIANAIEHGGGAVDVRVDAVAQGAVRIEFVDDGPGLPAPVAELARRGRRRRGPHGHGLAVAASVVVAHGGRLAGAPSQRGARVVLELPLTMTRRPAAVESPESGDDRGLGT
jgi:signal transduction histidine kinase